MLAFVELLTTFMEVWDPDDTFFISHGTSTRIAKAFDTSCQTLWVIQESIPEPPGVCESNNWAHDTGILALGDVGHRGDFPWAHGLSTDGAEAFVVCVCSPGLAGHE